MFGQSLPWINRASAVRALVVCSSCVLVVSPSRAQSVPAPPKVFYACYNKGTGTIYRIREVNLPQDCTSSQHVEFSWTDGIAGNDHGALAGLLDDDHPQYLLATGGRSLTGNFSMGGFKITNLAAGSALGDALRYEQAVKSGDAAGGDLNGTFPSPGVARLQGTTVAATVPATGQVLTFDGTAWAPATLSSGVTDHGALTGLGDDDHPKYLLLNGRRDAPGGFAVTGTVGTGTIPWGGPGTRMMWYPAKAAFRAGHVDLISIWDDFNTGLYSVAMGRNPEASGEGSVALGLTAWARGQGSVALGEGAKAFGNFAVAIGQSVTASGSNSIAVGANASTDSKFGSLVFGDGSSGGTVTPTANNQFVVRASGGTLIYSNAALTAGVSLATGAGSWASVSDVRRKENFRDLDADTVLARIARMPVREWNYRSQDSAVRHVGPTAQDFYAAFKLAASDTTITTIDIDGIALLAIQALERRTVQVSALEARLSALEQQLAQLLAADAARRPGTRNR